MAPVRFDDIRGKRLDVFLDDGGVLNDNRRRGPEWLRLIGEFMPARLGGEAQGWTDANRSVFSPLWARLQGKMPGFESYEVFETAYALGWMRGMCDVVGVPCPPDDEAIGLHRELACYVADRADAAIEGAIEAVRSLHGAGYTLRMASGTPSWELEGILVRMGVAGLFSEMYGPDLIDHVKYGPGYYEKIFAHAGVEPERALVIESDLECCRWAEAAGARAVRIDEGGRGEMARLADFVRELLKEGA